MARRLTEDRRRTCSLVQGRWRRLGAPGVPALQHDPDDISTDGKQAPLPCPQQKAAHHKERAQPSRHGSAVGEERCPKCQEVAFRKLTERPPFERGARREEVVTVLV